MDKIRKKKTATIPITVRFTEDQLNSLKELSHKLSLERHEDLNYIDLIREAVNKVYYNNEGK